MKVALDATPLLGRPTGVGRYVRGLLEGLAGLPDGPEIVLTAFSRSGGQPEVAGAEWSRRRVPARLLQACWGRGPLPPVEWLAGACDVFHATNFVLPPRRRAAGVVTIHDLTFEHHPGMVTPAVARYRELVPRAVRAAQVVLTDSQAVAAEVLERYPEAAGKVRVAALGVDPSWSHATAPGAAWLEARGLPAEYVLAVGTLEPRKNLATLVLAHARLRLTQPSVPRLLIVGPPGWGEPLGADPEHVVLSGWLEDADLRRVVAGASALAYPSTYEGFGLPPLEAFACGRPVACSDLPVLREVLGSLAEYADPHDPDDLAAALTRALDAPPEQGSAERREHAARWTWQTCAEQTQAAYAEAASLRG